MNIRVYKDILTDIPLMIGAMFVLSAFAYTFFGYSWWTEATHNRAFGIGMFHVFGVLLFVFRLVFIIDGKGK